MTRRSGACSRRGAASGVRTMAAALSMAAAGCGTSGPVTVRGDRFNFNKAGAQSTNEQILMNIVRLRFGEPIYFVEVGSMISHYSLAAGGRVGAWRNDVDAWDSPALRAVYDVDSYATAQSSWEAEVNYTDSPTITYAPLTGEEFARRTMARIPVGTILELAESGWDVQRLLECCVQRINNVANKPIYGSQNAAASGFDRFHQVAQLLQEGQDAELLRFTVEVEADRQATYLHTAPVPESMQGRRNQLRDLLDLPRDCDKLKLTTNSVKRERDELAMQMRSVLGTMYALAQEMQAGIRITEVARRRPCTRWRRRCRCPRIIRPAVSPQRRQQTDRTRPPRPGCACSTADFRSAGRSCRSPIAVTGFTLMTPTGTPNARSRC